MGTCRYVGKKPSEGVGISPVDRCSGLSTDWQINIETEGKQEKERKEGSDEKSRDCSRSSSGGSNLGAWHPPVAESLILSKYYMKEEKQ